MILQSKNKLQGRGFDQFYNDLRKKYPNTFVLAPDLGKNKDKENLRTLPTLEVGVNVNSVNPAQPVFTLTQNKPSFLAKVSYEKGKQSQFVEKSGTGGYTGPVIIKDNAVVTSSINTERPVKSNLISPSLRLSNLTTQIEQNRLVLRTRLKSGIPSPAVRKDNGGRTQQSSQELNKSQNLDCTIPNKSKSPTSGLSLPLTESLENLDIDASKKCLDSSTKLIESITKELLPNKPGPFLNHLPESNEDSNKRNGVSVSDSDGDSGISVGLSPKLSRSPAFQRTPAPPKLSPRRVSTLQRSKPGPMKADHTIPVNAMKNAFIQKENPNENVKSNSRPNSALKNSQDNAKLKRETTPSRVRFDDESMNDVESRYKERLSHVKVGEKTVKGPTFVKSGNHLTSTDLQFGKDSHHKTLNFHSVPAMGFNRKQTLQNMEGGQMRELRSSPRNPELASSAKNKPEFKKAEQSLLPKRQGINEMTLYNNQSVRSFGWRQNTEKEATSLEAIKISICNTPLEEGHSAKSKLKQEARKNKVNAEESKKEAQAYLNVSSSRTACNETGGSSESVMENLHKQHQNIEEENVPLKSETTVSPCKAMVVDPVSFAESSINRSNVLSKEAKEEYSDKQSLQTLKRQNGIPSDDIQYGGYRASPPSRLQGKCTQAKDGSDFGLLCSKVKKTLKTRVMKVQTSLIPDQLPQGGDLCDGYHQAQSEIPRRKSAPHMTMQLKNVHLECQEKEISGDKLLSAPVKNSNKDSPDSSCTSSSSTATAHVSPVHRVQTFLRKGRAKSYIMYSPTPPPPSERRPPSRGRENVMPQKEQRSEKTVKTLEGSVTGRLVKKNTDNTKVIELIRPSQGLFGLYFAKGSKNYDGGTYVVRLSGRIMDKLEPGMLEVGDELLEINSHCVKDLALDEIYSLLSQNNKVILKLLPLGTNTPQS
ncbi:uncharacterized protein LOC122790386 isoform X2 [Protopterus annectens]|uniref:uncharacterized protein LOC122790386 isoform X2 n=1 Tax=Protopterus annectens TaxID=7888 RepID=UPI001CFB688A|nr:uncharacterized protein LOC122790386 isoform X2 [Protopterus annectens]